MKKIGFISVPENTKAILWDMDGVLIDSMSRDFPFTNSLIKKYFGANTIITEDYIKSIYTWPIPEYWSLIFKKLESDIGIKPEKSAREAIASEFVQMRLDYAFDVFPDATATLNAARTLGIKNAVASNNPTEQVQKMLSRAGIIDRFDAIVGNDSSPDIKSKPAPDMYLLAAKKVGARPEECVVIEDSIVGAQAGKATGCYVIGVSTGALTKNQLKEAADRFDSVVI